MAGDAFKIAPVNPESSTLVFLIQIAQKLPVSNNHSIIPNMEAIHEVKNENLVCITRV
jgi:hypothetical protein